MPAPANWILPPPVDPLACRSLAEALGVPPLVATLLCRRGFSTAEEAALFLDPRLKTLRDPFLLPAMAPAVERLLAAIDRRERIVLYGDYDVDGVTSLTLFTRILRAFGADVRCFLPSRMEEGYGLSAEGLARCRETLHPRLLVAIDCGTSSAAEVEALTREGIDTIIFDHHAPKAETPRCVALVNPQLGHEGRELCSVGIMFKAAHALLKRRQIPGVDLREYLDLVALGTVADVVPLVRENRIFVKRGLVELGHSRWPGVRALVEVSGARPPFGATEIGFQLAPRLNAAGRLGTAQEALDLLLCDDAATARPLAESLDRQNRDRRAVEEAVFREAEAQVAVECDLQRDTAVVVGARDWHPGVVGIVASRLVRQFHRPALVAGFDGAGLGKGSGRSIAGFSLVSALVACGEHLAKHGGHEMAAGFALDWERFPRFRTAFLEHCGALLAPHQLCPQVHLEAPLTLREVNLGLLQDHDRLQPFGTANLQPLFFAGPVMPVAPPRTLKEKHLLLRLRQGNAEARAIWFGGAVEPLPPPPWQIAFRVNRNEWEGTVQPQVEIRALRSMVG